jgi:ABC-type phosphate/phosphonate transport system permease subunit
MSSVSDLQKIKTAEDTSQVKSDIRPAKWPLVLIAIALIVTLAWWIALVDISVALVRHFW